MGQTRYVRHSRYMRYVRHRTFARIAQTLTIDKTQPTDGTVTSITVSPYDTPIDADYLDPVIVIIE